MKKIFLLLLFAAVLTISAFSLNSCIKDASNSDDTEETQSTDTENSTEDKPDNGGASNLSKHKYGEFEYWLYSPDAAGHNLPLIVYLHDESDGGSGIDGMTQKEGLTKTLYEGGLNINAYILIPNLTGVEKSWNQARSLLQELISHVSSANSTDPSRVYLTGVGMGATGVYEIAMAMPNSFAAFAPVGGRVAENADPEKLKDVKLLVYADADIENPEAAAIMDFIFEVGRINDRTEIFALENYDSANYITLYSDMEYRLLETLLGY